MCVTTGQTRHFWRGLITVLERGEHASKRDACGEVGVQIRFVILFSNFFFALRAVKLSFGVGALTLRVWRERSALAV
jgi:hypothetical protein